MKTVVTITGIRPDFIRMAATFKLLDVAPDIKHIMVHTGQHFDVMLSTKFFDDLNIRMPDFNLQIGAPNKTHVEQSADLSVKIIDLFKREGIQPDLIVFLGDSNSVTCAVTLKKEGYKICHIEAGMRSHDRRMLEEINRVVCDHCSDLLLVYHDNYSEKLIQEGVHRYAKIRVVGNTIVEPCTPLANEYSTTPKEQHNIIVDIHRPENFLDPTRLQRILDFANYAATFLNTSVSLIDFKRTGAQIIKHNLNTGNIAQIPPMGFHQYTRALYNARGLISDSGTAQEEAALFQTPCVVPRDFTERPESVKYCCSEMLTLDNPESHGYALSFLSKPFHGDCTWLGDGTASVKIVDAIRNFVIP